MLLWETLVIALGTSVAKYLVQELLPRDWQDRFAADVLSAGVEWVTTKQPADPTGRAIGQRIKIYYEQSRLPGNEKESVAYEVARTLAVAETSLTHLITIGLDSQKLQQELVAERSEVLKALSADAEALYKQMLRMAAEAMVDTADQLNGFLRVALGRLLSGQATLGDLLREIEDDLHQVYEGLARWLSKPEQKEAAFRVKYQTHLADQLDRMEPFGIPKRDEIGQKLSLRDAFIGLRVKYRSFPQWLIMALRAINRHASEEQLQQSLNRILGWEPDDIRSSLLTVQLLRARPEDQAQTFLTGRVAMLDIDIPDLSRFDYKQLQLPPSGAEDGWRHVISKLTLDDSGIRDVPFRDAFAGERRIMLEGKAGTGKSSLLQWLAVQAAREEFPDSMADWKGLVPFFIRLRSCRDGEFPPPEKWLSLEARLIAGAMPPQWIHDHLESGRALVLIDGVDEMPKKQRDALLKELKSLVRNYPLARYVVSSRPTAVNEKQWPEWRNWLKEAAFAEVILQEMDNAQIDRFIERWHEAYAEVVESMGDRGESEATLSNAPRVKRLLRQREDLRKLAETPLLAAMICTLYQERGENIPRERLKLYEECIQMLLERREQKKDVHLADDYISLNEGEKIALLRALAYWMLDNELTSADVEDVTKVFERHIPRLSLKNIGSGREVLKLFVERVELLQEEVVGEISFRHRSFQEYLAADSANFESNIRVLVAKSNNDQWRETIILAFGMANRKDQGILLRGIINKAQKLKKETLRRQRLLLTLACLETGVDVDPELRREVLEVNRDIFPPQSLEEAEMIAKAGAMAVDMLHYDPDCPAALAAHSIRALAAVGGEAALEALAEYMAIDHWQIRRGIADSWDSFDHGDFARRILAQASEWSFSGLPTHPQWVQHIVHVAKLSFSMHAGDDLSPLTGLTQLTSLSLSLRSDTAVDLSSLAGLTQLTSLSLSLRSDTVVDLSPLAGLKQLTSLSLDILGDATVDLSPLVGLPQLNSLSLELPGVAAVDLSPLTSLPQLASLSLSPQDDAAVDLSLLADLTKLASLSLRSHAATDLSPLGSLSQLASLELRLLGDAVVDLNPLVGLSKLASLSVWGVPATDLTPLTNLSQLTSLLLWSDAAVDLGPLAGLSQLASLTLVMWGGATADLSPLVSLTRLSHLGLGLWNDSAADLSPLTSLAQLSSLEVWGNTAAHLGPLTGLSQLSSLKVWGNITVNLHELASLSQLSSLGLELQSDTRIDPSLLASLPQLSVLLLAGDTAIDVSLLASLPQLSILAISENLAQGLVSSLRSIPRQHGLTIFELNPDTAYIGKRIYPDDFESIKSKVTYLPARK